MWAHRGREYGPGVFIVLCTCMFLRFETARLAARGDDVNRLQSEVDAPAFGVREVRAAAMAHGDAPRQDATSSATNSTNRTAAPPPPPPPPLLAPARHRNGTALRHHRNGTALRYHRNGTAPHHHRDGLRARRGALVGEEAARARYRKRKADSWRQSQREAALLKDDGPTRRTSKLRPGGVAHRTGPRRWKPRPPS